MSNRIKWLLDRIKSLFNRGREVQKGQTMTEYALILAAIAVVVFYGYQTHGLDMKALLNAVDSQL